MKKIKIGGAKWLKFDERETKFGSLLIFLDLIIPFNSNFFFENYLYFLKILIPKF